MTSPAIQGNELGGILACYSTHHTPPESLPACSPNCIARSHPAAV
jgi:hypothetical protein